jgi:hypothetical protein
MTRRRLVLVAALLALALGVGWWALAPGLSAVERQMVGTWTYEDWERKGAVRTAAFLPDGRCWCPTDPAPRPSPAAPFRWSVRGDVVVFDFEPSRLRRALRPVAPLLGLSVRPTFSYRVEVAADRMVIFSPDGTPTAYTRAAAD